MSLQLKLTWVCVVLCALVGCNARETDQAKNDQQENKKKHLTVNASVSIDNNCTPNPAQATISTDGQVTWNPGSDGATIFFPITPFAKNTFTLSGATAGPSGTPNDVAKACAQTLGTCSFKYTININATGCTNDPIVIVSR